MPDASDASSALLQHLDAAYILARVLTPDKEAAADLVTTTFRAAAHAPNRPSDPDALRTWLLRRLVETHRTAPPSDEPALRDLQQAMADDVLQRLLPSAFASRPHPERVLLTLCTINGCTPAAAAEVLDLEASTAAERLQTARRRLWETVRANATTSEQQLLADQLTAETAAAALSDVLPDALTHLPPSLRPAAAAAIEAQTSAQRTSQAARSEPDQRETPDRPSARSETSSQPSTALRYARRSGTALLLILIAGLLAYLLANALQPSDSSEAPANLIELSVERVDQAEPGVSTRDPDEAQRYLREHTGRTPTIPTIRDAQLIGAGTIDLIEQVTVPTLFFADSTTGERITTYVFDYALLDRVRDRATLTTDVRRTLEEERSAEARTIGANGVLLWRERADIYLTVTAGSADSLKARLAFASSS